MKPRAYILVADDGMAYSVNGAAAAKGFEYMGYEIHPFRYAELESLELSPDTPVIGGMGTVKGALTRLGVEPSHVSVPACLYEFTGRRVWRATVSDVLAAGDYPIFVKPYHDLKVFSGTIVTSEDAFEALIAARPDREELAPDFPLFCQEPIKIISEWRAFVLRGRVLGVSHYGGDPLAFPDAEVMRQAIATYTEAGAPAGHSADFGVLVDGRTIVVEVNDGYALGCGSLLSSLYAELLRARWEELTRSAE